MTRQNVGGWMTAWAACLMMAIGCMPASSNDDDDDGPPNSGGAPANMMQPPMTMTSETDLFGGRSDTPVVTETALEDALKEAMTFCLREVLRMEPLVAEACDHQGEFRPVYEEAYEAVNALIERRQLAGRNAGYRIVSSAAGYAADSPDINVLNCSRDPLMRSELNAFAMANSVVILDRLNYALTEGAVFWQLLNEDAGTTELDEAQIGQLLAGLGQIFYNADQGQFFQVVDESRVGEYIQAGGFATQVFSNALIFVFLHELAHVNLHHSMINHGVQRGIPTVLQEAGLDLTDEQRADLARGFTQLKVATETQADIYANSLMASEMGASSHGVRLFALGMAGLRWVSGQCDATLPEEQLRSCLVGDRPEAAHPPLDVRVSLAKRILDDGEDLTHLLDPGELGDLDVGE